MNDFDPNTPRARFPIRLCISNLLYLRHLSTVRETTSRFVMFNSKLEVIIKQGIVTS